MSTTAVLGAAERTQMMVRPKKLGKKPAQRTIEERRSDRREASRQSKTPDAV
jgi:hypothetical protein